MHSHLAVLPAGIGTVLTKVNGCRGFIGPVPLPALDGLYSITSDRREINFNRFRQEKQYSTAENPPSFGS